jgi:hypothetical protein
MRMRPVLLVLALLALPSLAEARMPAMRWTPVATYLNDPAHEAQAERMRADLDAHGIRSVTTCSAGCTISVPQGRGPEAVTLMHAIATRESLDIAVIVPPTS